MACRHALEILDLQSCRLMVVPRLGQPGFQRLCYLPARHGCRETGRRRCLSSQYIRCLPRLLPRALCHGRKASTCYPARYRQGLHQGARRFPCRQYFLRQPVWSRIELDRSSFFSTWDHLRRTRLVPLALGQFHAARIRYRLRQLRRTVRDSAF